jgi:hypothetical protein
MITTPVTFADGLDRGTAWVKLDGIEREEDTLRWNLFVFWRSPSASNTWGERLAVSTDLGGGITELRRVTNDGLQPLGTRDEHARAVVAQFAAHELVRARLAALVAA